MMDKRFKRNLLAAVIAGMLLPAAAMASEADLLKRIEALAQQNEMLAKELQALKNQVQTNQAKPAPAAAAPAADAAALEDLKGQVALLQKKSLGNWLTVGATTASGTTIWKGRP